MREPCSTPVGPGPDQTGPHSPTSEAGRSTTAASRATTTQTRSPGVSRSQAIASSSATSHRRPPRRSGSRSWRRASSSRYVRCRSPPSRASSSQGIGVRACSPSSPVSPSSSPAKTIGIPGCPTRSASAATSAASSPPRTLSARGVSCEPSRVTFCSVCCQGTAAANSRIAATTSAVGLRGTGTGMPRKP